VTFQFQYYPHIIMDMVQEFAALVAPFMGTLSHRVMHTLWVCLVSGAAQAWQPAELEVS
jgi:hypothetical protein